MISDNTPSQNRINMRYQLLLDDYLKLDLISSFQNGKDEIILQEVIDQIEKKEVLSFLEKGCGCSRNCQNKFSEKELLSTRAQFRSLSLSERNCYILAQLRVFSKHSDQALSARAKTTRQKQKFEYLINSDRITCRDAFLFYHGESIKRLQRLQECLEETPLSPPLHGNKGRQPINAYPASDRDLVKTFILSLAETQGLPDPGRDVRKGKGRLRILLPSVMSFTSIHRLYEASILEVGKEAIPYRTFLEIWQKELPHIEFNNPRSDLCMTCENFRKEINQTTSSDNEEKENLLTMLYQKALDHLNYVKKERLYYKAHSKESSVDYKKIKEEVKNEGIAEANSKDVVMSYSWDFAQQLLYPFEDQQVGPIYFKTPRRAQLFGVCCEGDGQQVNYLIDEADFLEKNANTVVSLLDHFFSNYGLGEMTVYLTADNCVGQNKNNCLIQYLMYRILSGLHSTIELSFLVAGHTKFSPDSHFGLIRQRYRRSQIYTYEQLAKVIEASTPNEYNHCHRVQGNNDSHNKVIYRDWTSWLSKYFTTVPKITNYHHFMMSNKKSGTVSLKINMDSAEETVNIIKTSFDFESTRVYPPGRLHPVGLSDERQWYLYSQIRQHIPDECDKNITCPKPTCSKPKPKKEGKS